MHLERWSSIYSIFFLKIYNNMFFSETPQLQSSDNIPTNSMNRILRVRLDLISFLWFWSYYRQIWFNVQLTESRFVVRVQIWQTSRLEVPRWNTSPNFRLGIFFRNLFSIHQPMQSLPWESLHELCRRHVHPLTKVVYLYHIKDRYCN